MKKTFVMGWTALAVSLGGLVMMSGCMVGPDYKPPQTAMPPSWSGPTNSTTNAGTRFSDNTANLAGWWTRFQDPKLTELVNAALRTNLDVRLAETLLRQARAARGIDAGGLWPSLTANGFGHPHRLGQPRRHFRNHRRGRGSTVEFGHFWRHTPQAGSR